MQTGLITGVCSTDQNREYEDEIDRMRARQNRKKGDKAAWKKEIMKPVEDPNSFWFDTEDPDWEEIWLEEEEAGPEEDYWPEEEPMIPHKLQKRKTDRWDEDLEEISLEDIPDQKKEEKKEIEVTSFEKRVPRSVNHSQKTISKGTPQKKATPSSMKAVLSPNGQKDAMSVLPQISTSININDILSLAKQIDRYHLGENTGFPFSRGEARIHKQSCVIPLTLESNVAQLHQFLYGTENYTPSAAVRKISNQIASDSGMGEIAENAPEISAGNSNSSSSGANNSSNAHEESSSPLEVPNGPGFPGDENRSPIGPGIGPGQ